MRRYPRWRAGRELHAGTTCIVRIDRSEPPTRLSEESQSSHHASPSDLTPSEASDTPTLRLPIPGRSSPIVSPQRTTSIQEPIGRSQATERPPRRPRFRVSPPRGAPNHCPRPEGQTEAGVERTRRNHIVWPGRQALPSESDTRSCPKTDDRGLTAGDEDTFPRFVAFQRNQMHRSLRAGLPPQRLPLSGFLTLSAVSSRCTLVAVFQATSTHRLDGSSELLPPQSAVMSLDILLLSCHQALQDASSTSRPAPAAHEHSSRRTDWGVFGTAGGPGSRALLRPGVRHSVRRVNVEQSRCSPDLLPLRGVPARSLGRTLPSCTCRRATSEEAPADGATGSQSDRTWARLPREPRQPP
jgi:hypothetical protein